MLLLFQASILSISLFSTHPTVKSSCVCIYLMISCTLLKTEGPDFFFQTMIGKWMPPSEKPYLNRPGITDSLACACFCPAFVCEDRAVLFSYLSLCLRALTSRQADQKMYIWVGNYLQDHQVKPSTNHTPLCHICTSLKSPPGWKHHHVP